MIPDSSPATWGVTFIELKVHCGILTHLFSCSAPFFPPLLEFPSFFGSSHFPTCHEWGGFVFSGFGVSVSSHPAERRHWEVSNIKPVQELALHSFYLVPSRSGIVGMGCEVEPLPEILWLWVVAGLGHVLAVQSQKKKPDTPGCAAGGAATLICLYPNFQELFTEEQLRSHKN